MSFTRKDAKKFKKMGVKIAFAEDLIKEAKKAKKKKTHLYPDDAQEWT